MVVAIVVVKRNKVKKNKVGENGVKEDRKKRVVVKKTKSMVSGSEKLGQKKSRSKGLRQR